MTVRSRREDEGPRVGEGLRTLVEGDRVSFEVTQDPKGLQAANVRKV